MAQLNTLLLLGLAAFVVIIIGRTARDFFSEWRAKRRTENLRTLNDELEQLCKDISTHSTLRLTTEHIPQRFPSKAAAREFGEKWSRGGVDSFSAKSIDSQNRDEDHPDYDQASISGGILYTYPALFFGLKETHREDDEWFLEFTRAKNQWLKDYLAHLKQSREAN